MIRTSFPDPGEAGGCTQAADRLKRPFDEHRGQRPRPRQQAAGRDLRPVILAMLEYGDRHLAGDDGPPVRVEHTGCGAPVHVEVRCAEGHLVESGTRLRSVPGPGARRVG